MRRTHPSAAAASAAGADAARTRAARANAFRTDTAGLDATHDDAGASRTSSAFPRGWAWAVAWFAILLASSALVLAVVGARQVGDLRSLVSHQALTPFITAGFAVIGGLVATRRPGN